MSKNGLKKKGRSAHSEELRFTLDSAGRGTAATQAGAIQTEIGAGRPFLEIY